MKLYVGISGGHHKSVAVSILEDQVTAVVVGESLNLHAFDRKEVGLRIANLIALLAEKIEIAPKHLKEDTVTLCVALPGAAKEADQQLAKYSLVKHAGWRDTSRALVVDDTWAGLIAGGLSPNGVCAFAGTGASVLVSADTFGGSPPLKFDGLGPVLGDFGSGFQLVVDLFRLMGRRTDRDGVSPPLLLEFQRLEPEIIEMVRAQQWFDSLYLTFPNDWRTRFARLAEIATSAADRTEPDPDAVALVTKAGEDLAETIDIALNRCPHAEALPIILQGGMFEHSRLYREVVAATVRRSHDNPIRMAQFKTVFGAGLIAAAGGNPLPSADRTQRIVASIRTLNPDDVEELIYPDWSYPLIAEAP